MSVGGEEEVVGEKRTERSLPKDRPPPASGLCSVVTMSITYLSILTARRGSRNSTERGFCQTYVLGDKVHTQKLLVRNKSSLLDYSKPHDIKKNTHTCTHTKKNTAILKCESCGDRLPNNGRYLPGLVSVVAGVSVSMLKTRLIIHSRSTHGHEGFRVNKLKTNSQKVHDHCGAAARRPWSLSEQGSNFQLDRIAKREL